MSKTTPLSTLLDLAHTRVDEATKRLGELISGEHACEVKLEMLRQYRVEYRDRFLVTARGGIDPNAWRNYSGFLQKLDDAILHQEQIVAHSKHLTQQGQQKWVSERNRMKAFDTLTQRQHQKEQRLHNKQEQRQTDEHAIKHHLEKRDEASEN